MKQLERIATALKTCIPLMILSACSPTNPGPTGGGGRPSQPPPDPTPTSGFAVGTSRTEIDVSSTRRVPVQIWYPAVESARAAAVAGRSVAEFEPSGPQRDRLSRIMRDAPPEYTQRTMHAADSPAVHEQAGKFPLVLISHCNDCTRFAYFSIAEHLASKGFVVAAPDHVNNTLYDMLAGKSVGIELNSFLEQRRLDMFALTDTMLDPSADAVPEGLRGRMDPERIGMLGHSFGTLTTGYASTRDPRIRAIAVMTMIISMDNKVPAVGPELAQRVQLQPFSKPALFIVANEDIFQLFGGNDLVHQNFATYPKEAWYVSMADAGHFSVTNICGITRESLGIFLNGCGRGTRASRFPQQFTYLNVERATSYTKQFVTAYFEKQLLGTSATTLESVAARAPSILKLEHHTP